MLDSTLLKVVLMFQSVRRPDVLVIVLAAAGILMVSMAIRQSFGLLVSPISGSTGMGIAAISFAMAIAQLNWGAASQRLPVEARHCIGEYQCRRLCWPICVCSCVAETDPGGRLGWGRCGGTAAEVQAEVTNAYWPEWL